MFNALTLATVVITASPAPVPAPQALPVAVVRAPGAALRVQVARSEEQREHGLMGVRHLPKHTGMLFVFERDAPVAFWMKDTLIPLDMVFVGADGVVRRVYSNVPIVARTLPDSKIPLEQGTAKYVIELPAGEAAEDGLHAGVRVTPLP
jgi:uncharacterized membrane protein (UPF0127 family)